MPSHTSKLPGGAVYGLLVLLLLLLSLHASARPAHARDGSRRGHVGGFKLGDLFDSFLRPPFAAQQQQHNSHDSGSHDAYAYPQRDHGHTDHHHHHGHPAGPVYRERVSIRRPPHMRNTNPDGFVHHDDDLHDLQAELLHQLGHAVPHMADLFNIDLSFDELEQQEEDVDVKPQQQQQQQRRRQRPQDDKLDHHHQQQQQQPLDDGAEASVHEPSSTDLPVDDDLLAVPVDSEDEDEEDEDELEAPPPKCGFFLFPEHRWFESDSRYLLSLLMPGAVDLVIDLVDDELVVQAQRPLVSSVFRDLLQADEADTDAASAEAEPTVAANDDDTANAETEATGRDNAKEEQEDEPPTRELFRSLDAPRHEPVGYRARFLLPKNIDANDINALVHNGVVYVSIPKRSAVSPTRVNVKYL